ncbi:NAD-dependent epimerase/dehydratase family protein [Pseudomonadales bacterium]|nr:NAD-dependent epimerase/dehydratase family protein [Pseudomonadales bacterium]
MKVLVSGSSGYVASDLIPRLKEKMQILGVDYVPSEHTDICTGIESDEFKQALTKIIDGEINIINLAAARFDFGATAKDYYDINVRCHELFLSTLSEINIKNFVHVSSVAAFDGRNITYTEELNCDDAYRATKYLQEVLVKDWCQGNHVNLTILYPSAIFSENARSDTNIGKMQVLSGYLPFVPEIDVHKSLTYLPKFSAFIVDLINEKLPLGQYLAIEQPSLAVSEMIRILSGRALPVLHVPGLRITLKIVAKLLFAVGGFGKIDMKLTPNRVTKLFSDTMYADLNDDQVDSTFYTSTHRESLTDILANFKHKE